MKNLILGLLIAFTVFETTAQQVTSCPNGFYNVPKRSVISPTSWLEFLNDSCSYVQIQAQYVMGASTGSNYFQGNQSILGQLGINVPPTGGNLQYQISQALVDSEQQSYYNVNDHELMLVALGAFHGIGGFANDYGWYFSVKDTNVWDGSATRSWHFEGTAKNGVEGTWSNTNHTYAFAADSIGAYLTAHSSPTYKIGVDSLGANIQGAGNTARLWVQSNTTNNIGEVLVDSAGIWAMNSNVYALDSVSVLSLTNIPTGQTYFVSNSGTATCTGCNWQWTGAAWRKKP